MAGLLRKWNRVHEEMREDSLTTTPKISIIIPVYNVEDYLRPCLDSMIDQTVKEIEIICVDDGSTDGSGTLCDRYQARFPAMVRVLHQKNQGVSAARNAGMQMARGEYLTFVDPDDWLEPDMLRTMLEEMQKENAQAAFCGFAERFCSAEKEDILHEPEKRGTVDGIEALYQCLNGVGHGYFSAVWGKMFRVDALRGADGTLPAMKPYAISEDELWLAQVVPSLERVVLLPEVYYNWRQREGSALHAGRTFSHKWYSALEAKKEIAALLAGTPRFDDLREAKIYADLANVLWQSWCYGTRQDYHYFRKELTAYKKAFYCSKKFSRARKAKIMIVDIMIFLHLPKDWIEMFGEATVLELKRKLYRKH